LRRTLDPNTTLLVVSDHGASAETDAAQLFEARLEEWTAILGLRDIAIPMDITGAHCLYFLDRSYTAPTQRLLEEARDKRNGHKLFVGFVQRDGHLMFFPTREPIGDTVIIPNHGEYPFDQLCRRAVTRHSAEHHPEGIFIVAGPSIRRGIQLGAGSILDVAPNLLALLGLPIARDMDGRLWDKMFRPGHSFDFVETYETQEAQEVSTENLSSEDVDLLYERLRDLGYV
jgi:arylsulfatase A-like enzyme